MKQIADVLRSLLLSLIYSISDSLECRRHFEATENNLLKFSARADKRCEFCLLCILYYCHSHVGLHGQCTERQKNKNVQLQIMEQSKHWTTFYNNKSAVKSRIKRLRIENVIIISFKERIIYTTIICEMSCRDIESFGTHHMHNIKSYGEHLVFLRI